MTAMFIDVIFLLQPWPILQPPLLQDYFCPGCSAHQLLIYRDPGHLARAEAARSSLCRKMRRMDRVLFQLYVVPSPEMTPMTVDSWERLIDIETDQRNRPEELQNLVGESGWWLETSHFLRLSWMYWEKAIGLMRRQTLSTSRLCSQRITLYRYAAMIRHASCAV